MPGVPARVPEAGRGCAQGHALVPAQGHVREPAQGHERVPAQGHVRVPAQGHERVPAQGRSAGMAEGLASADTVNGAAKAERRRSANGVAGHVLPDREVVRLAVAVAVVADVGDARPAVNEQPILNTKRITSEARAQHE